MLITIVVVFVFLLLVIFIVNHSIIYISLLLEKRAKENVRAKLLNEINDIEGKLKKKDNNEVNRGYT